MKAHGSPPHTHTLKMAIKTVATNSTEKHVIKGLAQRGVPYASSAKGGTESQSVCQYKPGGFPGCKLKIFLNHLLRGSLGRGSHSCFPSLVLSSAISSPVRWHTWRPACCSRWGQGEGHYMSQCLISIHSVSFKVCRRPASKICVPGAGSLSMVQRTIPSNALILQDWWQGVQEGHIFHWTM